LLVFVVAHEFIDFELLADFIEFVGAAASNPHVVDGLLVKGEESAGGALLGGHVGDGAAVSHSQGVHPGPEEFHEFADYTALSQHLHDGEHQVGGSGEGGEGALELHADHLRQDHRDVLTQHHGLSLDAAHAPAEHAEPVDHGGVRVGADNGVRLEHIVDVHDSAGQLLEVDLVHDSGSRGHNEHVLEGGLPPLEELEALLVAFELDFLVHLERVAFAEGVHLD